MILLDAAKSNRIHWQIQTMRRTEYGFSGTGSKKTKLQSI
jgi:hypothetical protein